MSANKKNVRQNPTLKKSDETEIKGRVVSRGIGIGRVIELFGKKRQFFRIELKENQIEKELRRFRAGVRLAKRQTKKILASLTGKS